MLTLYLVFDGQLGSVYINGKESHAFTLMDLSLTKQGLKDFVANPRPYGGKLFQTLFKDGSEAHKAFDELSKQTERTIILVLESSELDGIAWEYAYHDNAFIVEDFAFMRALPRKERPHTNGRLSKSVERVPLLFIPANPLVDLSGEPLRELDIESEWREMTQHIVKSNAPFDLIELRPATPAALQSVMARFQNGMIAHFSGHGTATKDGAFLLFENENGSSNPLEAREFVREVKDQAWIGFLSACQSAVAERTEYSNLARELVKAGVPFALGMQFNLPDLFAPNISGQFYNYLSQGHAIPDAARQARRAVKRENEFYVGMIALYAAHPDDEGKIQWSGSGARTLSTFAEADVSDLPAPASGLIGRQRELMHIGTRLLEGKKPLTVTLHGAGGIGKTALLWQSLQRFAPSFELTLAIGLDPLPSLESALGRIERFLGFPSPCANDTKERETLVRNALTSKRTLLGLDNFETLNHALNDDETKGTAKSLYAFFKSLPAAGATLCVTSREKTSLPGEHIEEIYGLEDAMGGALFYENVSTRRDALNQASLEKLSAAAGGHPLALRLLAPTFEEQAGLSLEGFTIQLQGFLPKASDQWTEQERHESLGACFAFSMDNLPKNKNGERLRIAISRLSVFTGYFYEATAAIVLENHRSDFENSEKIAEMWSDARKTLHMLWERGLLERATIEHEKGISYIYCFHPVLNQFAMEYLDPKDQSTVVEMHRTAMDYLSFIAVPTSTDRGFFGDGLLSIYVRLAMPDLLKAVKQRGNKETLNLLLRIAFLKHHFGEWDDAMQFYQQGLEIVEELGNLQRKAIVLEDIARFKIDRGELDEAMKLFQQALKIDEENGDLAGKAKILTGMALINVMSGNSESGMHLYEQAMEIYEGLGDLLGKSLILHSIANIYSESGGLDQAVQYYQQSIKIDNELGDFKGKSDTLCELANIHAKRGEFDEAIRLYQESLNISEWLGDEPAKADTLRRIAPVYEKLGDFDKALELYNRSQEIYEKLGDLRNVAIIKDQIAKIYEARGDWNKAIYWFKQALEIVENLGDRLSEAKILLAIAFILAIHNELEQALDLCQRSLGIFDETGDLRERASALVVYSSLLMVSKDYSRMIQASLEGMRTFSSLDMSADAQKVAENLIVIRQAIGTRDFDKAWKEITGEPIPEWLRQQAKKQQDMPTEQFIADAIQSAREKSPEAEGYFKEAQRLAIDSNARAELQSLGKVLQRIMIGQKNVDLSALTDELREMVEKALAG